MKKKTLEILEHEDFLNISRGASREDPRFAHYYVDLHLDGWRIVFKNLKIEGDHNGHLPLGALPSPISLLFENCELPSIRTSVQIDELIFDNCNIIGLTINSVIKSVSLIGKRSTIEAINFEPTGRSPETALSGKVGSINFPSTLAKEGRMTNVISDADINQINIQGLYQLSIESSGILNELILDNSGYPFKGFARIGKLIIERSNAEVNLCGIFGSIAMDHASGSVHLNNVICLGNLTITNPLQSSHYDTLLEIGNMYVGGQLLLEKFNGVIHAELRYLENEFICINDLYITKKLKDVQLVSQNAELPIRINTFSMVDVVIEKDVHWYLDGLLVSVINLVSFRNIGTGNIYNTRDGNFALLPQSFAELTREVQSEDRLKDFISKWNWKYENPPCQQLNWRFSDLGKINFINSDFSTFRMLFSSAKISEIFLAGSRLPKSIDVDVMADTKKMRHQQRIANSQLKKLHEQQGDILASNEYFANEMNAYYGSLSWWKNFFEKLPLAMNGISSNHGQSWIRAFGLTLLVTLVSFSLFVHSMGYELARVTPETLTVFKRLSGFVLEYLNPLHKLESFEKINPNKEFSTSSRLIDGTSRILISYCVYQLIQAFRKHGRSR